MKIKEILRIFLFYLITFVCLGGGDQLFFESQKTKKIRKIVTSNKYLARAIRVKDEEVNHLIVHFGFPDLNYIEEQTGMNLIMISLSAENKLIFDYLLKKGIDLKQVNSKTNETIVDMAKNAKDKYYLNQINKIELKKKR